MPAPMLNDERLEAVKLREQLPSAVLHVDYFRGDVRITIAKEFVVQACELLRDDPELKYRYISDVVGVDYLTYKPQRHLETRFEIVISIYSHKHFSHCFIKYGVNEGETAPSVTSVWKGADWMEREIYDMFGIPFEGHPDLRRILMPDDWVGHPLLKDFPLGGEKIPFDQNTIGPSIEDLQTPHAGESFYGKTSSRNVSDR